MRMTAKLKEAFSRVRSSLTSLDRQPLSKAALIIILFLDIFILTAIFNGLDEHTRQLTSPDDRIPSTCREIVINNRWNATNRIDNLSQIVISHSTRYYPVEEKKKDRHPVCAPYLDLVEQIRNDKALTLAFEDRAKFVQEARELQREIGNLKGAYDTSLLETIAKQKQGQAHVQTLQQDIRKKTETLNTLQGQIVALDHRINDNEKIKLLWERLEGLLDQDRETLKIDLRTMYFWHPVKRLGMQMLFLLPLFSVFYVWNNASIRKNRGIQALVSSHLLVVSFIPIFFKIIETVYDIIPKKLLKKLMDLLESLKLVAVWHYLVIAITVAAALFLIYLFQKKLFSREKLIERRITKGQCQECSKHLPAGSVACPFCGFAQFKACSSCGKMTLVYGKYCKECGKGQ
jgi:RNA polymerase subunit RPABC4/transcription elongation factor Spt4